MENRNDLREMIEEMRQRGFSISSRPTHDKRKDADGRPIEIWIMERITPI